MATSTTRQRTFTRLEVRQGVGSLSIQQNDSCLTITSAHDIVAYCDDRTNALSIYGLAKARVVTYKRQTFQEYISGSTKSLEQSPTIPYTNIRENYIPRNQFTTPSTTIVLTNVRLALTSILLDGCISLNNINPLCIDTECNVGKIFNLDLHKTAALRCPLAAVIVTIRMYEETIISSYQTVENQRYLWSLHNAIFHIEACRYIEGIEVSNALNINAPTQRMINAVINKSSSCSYKTIPRSLVVFEGEYTPPPPPSSSPRVSSSSSISRSSSSSLGIIYADDDVDFDFDTLLNNASVDRGRPSRRDNDFDFEFDALLNNRIVDRGRPSEPDPLRHLFHASRRRRDRQDSFQHVLDASRREYEADCTPLAIIPKDSRTPIEGNINAVAQITSEKGEECTICMTNRATVAFSCGHVTVCPDCVVSYRSYSSTCPLCRAPIRHITILYMDQEKKKKETLDIDHDDDDDDDDDKQQRLRRQRLR